MNRSLTLMAATGCLIALTSSEMRAQRGRGGGIGSGERIGTGSGIGSGERFGSSYSVGGGFTSPARPTYSAPALPVRGGVPTVASGMSSPRSAVSGPTAQSLNGEAGTGNYMTQGGMTMSLKGAGSSGAEVGRGTGRKLLGVSTTS